MERVVKRSGRVGNYCSVKDKKHSEAWWKTTSGCRAEQRKKYNEQIFEEMKELEEKKSEETLLLLV